MAIVLMCLSGLSIIGGTLILFNVETTWRIKKFVDNYAPSAMPEYWESTNRSIGVGLIAVGLLLVFLTAAVA
jgi:hypothetical protein